jgi:hypothetical protein
MAKEPMKIQVEPGSELAELLARAGAMPVLLETEGALYRLDRMPKEATLPTPEEVSRSRAGIVKAAGSWKEIDTEQFKAYVSRRRRTATRPSIRL